VRGQKCPPAPVAHQSSSRKTPFVPTIPMADPHWTMVPTQQMPLHNIYNPINHMHQQQMDYEMYKRQQTTHMESQYGSVSSMPDTTNIMTRATMLPNPFPSVPLYSSQEMVDYNVMQRYQHERYLQQAREMQMADIQAEQVEMFNQVQEAARINAEKCEDEERRGLKRRNSYRAVLRNGELVEDENGYLKVTHNNMVVNNVPTAMNMATPTLMPMLTAQVDTPLNLSMKDQRMTTSYQLLDTDSGFKDSAQ